MNTELITAAATQDGRNMAACLKTLKSGMHTYAVVFRALEQHYAPFLSNDFKRAFFKEVYNDK